MNPTDFRQTSSSYSLYITSSHNHFTQFCRSRTACIRLRHVYLIPSRHSQTYQIRSISSHSESSLPITSITPRHPFLQLILLLPPPNKKDSSYNTQKVGTSPRSILFLLQGCTLPAPSDARCNIKSLISSRRLIFDKATLCPRRWMTEHPLPFFTFELPICFKNIHTPIWSKGSSLLFFILQNPSRAKTSSCSAGPYYAGMS
jgi:hypothetical protein